MAAHQPQQDTPPNSTPQKHTSPLPEISTNPIPSGNYFKHLAKEKLKGINPLYIKIAAGAFAVLVVLGIARAAIGAVTNRTSSKPRPTPTPSPTPVAELGEGEIEFVTENLEKEEQEEEKEEFSPTPTIPQTTTKILLGEGDLDGYVTSEGEVTTTDSIKIGRNINYVSRGFFSFDLTELPTGITVQEASLRLYQNSIIGTPYVASGEIRVDHLTYGEGLSANHYSTPALTSNLVTLSTSKRIGWKEAIVTQAVREDVINARSKSQYRVHFSSETKGGDEKGDFSLFISADNKGNQYRPQLVIEYY